MMGETQSDLLVQPVSEAEDIGPFRMTTPIEISFVLRNLAQRGDCVTIYFNNGHDLLLTRILDADVKAGIFYFDLSGNPQNNDALQRAEKAVFVASPDGIKVQFSTHQIRPVLYDGQSAFQAPLPPDLIKVQRREFFRLPIPIANPYICSFTIPDLGSYRLEIHDISLGGVGMWVPESLVQSLNMGFLIKAAVFDFGASGIMTLDIEVRNVRPVVTRSGNTQYIMGVRFKQTTRIQENNLQRLVAHLERERKALLG